MEFSIEFTYEKITPPDLALTSREIGASVEFLGIVREREGEESIQGLTYEAYEAMARKRIAAHIAELGDLHPCSFVQLTHRLGPVPVGQASLFIRVLSAHRQPALELLSHLIDRLKEDVPIWKKAGILS
jgi:molybdopterin synthase catalytic subunit